MIGSATTTKVHAMNHTNSKQSASSTVTRSAAPTPLRVRSGLRAGWTISVAAMIPGIGTRTLGASVDGTGGGM